MPKPSRVPVRETAPESERRDRAFGVSGAAVETTSPKTRRRFSAAEKLRIIKEADAGLASGQRGAVAALLRREGIYSSHLSAWRVQLGASGAAGLERRKPGRKPKFDAKDLEIQRLTKQLARAEDKLYVANALIDLQKKVHAMLGIPLPKLDVEP